MQTTSSNRSHPSEKMSIERKQAYRAKRLIWMELRLKLLRKHTQEQQACCELGRTERLVLKDTHLEERSRFYEHPNDKPLNWFALLVRQSMELTELSQTNQLNRRKLLIKQTEEEERLEELIAFQEQLYESCQKALSTKLTCNKTQ
ncbi:hypothetical protein G8759_14465 [Spirosoma aureum]|uniref:Uncharacterized protein n=1 Tax=Spirosoma aureum TaxID=2692134 RepID=A0A6G9AML3_9BACT|nr:hypothetical protein [Spirosoma aureum]QIP13732.1 hypothetical protein G8759_14465 [Spirosoma aureum]